MVTNANGLLNEFSRERRLRMKRMGLVVLVVVIVSSGALAHTNVNHVKRAATGKATRVHRTHVVITPETIRWEPLTEGAEIIVLAGDPFNLKKRGVPFVFRVKHKDGFALKPHWHPMDEYITVLTGAMLLGTGDEFKTDPAHVREMPAGSYAYMPKIMRHYFVTRGETVVQFQGIGPFRMTFVNPADDPRPPAERH
jgi:hypothetical protein